MKKFTKIAGLTAITLLAAKGLDNRIELSYYTVESPKLPKVFNNFKIVHISDYHNDPVAGLIGEVRNEEPDIIVMTGDMTHDNGTYLPAVELIKKLIKIAPCYIVSGNHDIWRSDYNEYISACKDTGAVFLQNERTEIRREDSLIYISGMEDAFTKVRLKNTVKKYLEHFSVTDEYQILLFHRANALDFIKDFGFDLILSGHLHGGQFRIPGIGGLFSPLSSLSENGNIFFPKYFGGRYDCGNTAMIVNRGTGNPTPIPRLFNRPEIGVITLKSTM